MSDSGNMQGRGESLATKIYAGVILAGALFAVLASFIILSLMGTLQSHQVFLEKTLPVVQATQTLERSVFDYLLIVRSESLFDTIDSEVSEDQLVQSQQMVNEQLSRLKALISDEESQQLADVERQLQIIFTNANVNHGVLLPTHRELDKLLQQHRTDIEVSINKAQSILHRYTILHMAQSNSPQILRLRKTLALLNEPVFKYVVGQGKDAIEPKRMNFNARVRDIARVNILLANDDIRKRLATINKKLLFHVTPDDGFFACALAIEANIERSGAIDHSNRVAERALNDGLLHIVALSKDRSQHKLQQIKSRLQQDLWVMLLVLGLIFIITFLVVNFYVKPYIINRLHHLTAWMKQISSGDYTQPMDTLGQDEIAQMARVLERFRVHLIERDELNELIQTNEIYLQSIIEHAADGLLTLNSHGDIETYNPACEHIFGYSKASLQEQGLSIDDIIKDGAALIEDLVQAPRSESVTCIGIHAHGHEIPIELSLNTSAVSQSVRAIIIIRDVSERKRAEDERERLIMQLTNSNHELERFAYVASHDLQEPLRMVRNFCDLLDKRYGDQLDQDARQYISIAASSATRMQDLIEDLLEYARISETVDKYSDVDLNQVVQSALENIHDTIEETNAEIDLAVLPIVLGNRIRLIRVFTNICSNALKYQLAGQIPTIVIRAYERDDGWEVCVQDNGIGMRPEYCEQIFLPFNRLHGKSEFPGTGIGLAICKKILTMLNGNIWASSQEGKGTTIHLFFPRHASTHI